MKNYKPSFLFLAFLLFQTVSFCQDDYTFNEIKKGDKIKLGKKEILNSEIQVTENGYYIISKKVNSQIGLVKDDLRIYHFDESLSKKSSKKINLNKGIKKRRFEKFVSLEGQLFLFSSAKKNKENQKTLFYQIVNPSTLELGSLEEIQNIKFLRKIDKDGIFEFSISPDGSKILVYQNENLKNGKFRTMLSIFDSEMKLIWEKQEEIKKGKNDGLDWSQMVVDNQGNVFGLLKTYDTPKGIIIRRSFLAVEFEFYSYLKNGEHNIVQKIDDKNKEISDLMLFVEETGQVVILGFYSDEYPNSTEGVVKIILNSENEIDNAKTSFQKFSKPLISSYEKNGDKDLMLKYSLTSINKKENGNFVIVGEQLSISDLVNDEPSVSSTFYYRNLLTSEINKDGTIVWEYKIPKYEYSTNEVLSRFFIHNYKESSYLFYIDHPINIKISESKNAKSPFVKRHIMATQINAKGELVKQPFFPSRKAKNQFIYEIGCKKISEDKVVLILADKYQAIYLSLYSIN